MFRESHLVRPISRRRFLRAATTAALAGGMAFRARRAGAAVSYEGLATRKYLGEVRIETRIVDTKVFTEGPAVDRSGVVYFTSTEVAKILRWDPAAKELTTFRENSGGANGLAFDPEGRLLACEGTAGRVTRTDTKSGELSVLCDGFGGHPLGLPNDVCLDGAGRIYFTSRLPNADPEQGNVNAVYRIDSDSKTHRILHLPDIHMPNGLVVSPDDRTFYLVESAPEENRNRCILAYDLQPDGSVKNGRKHVNFYPGRSGDGMRIDAEGNLYIAAGLHKTRKTSETLDTRPGIHVVNPKGELVAFVETPEDTITNCAFGGEDLRTLYVTCGTYLLSLRTNIPGKPAYRPKS